MSRARYVASLREISVGSVIAVIDLYSQKNPSMSVTNDAESVVEEVVASFGNHRVFYLDTDAVWDELLHDNGKFLGFAPGDEVRLEL